MLFWILFEGNLLFVTLSILSVQVFLPFKVVKILKIVQVNIFKIATLTSENNTDEFYNSNSKRMFS